MLDNEHVERTREVALNHLVQDDFDFFLLGWIAQFFVRRRSSPVFLAIHEDAEKQRYHDGGTEYTLKWEVISCRAWV